MSQHGTQSKHRVERTPILCCRPSQFKRKVLEEANNANFREG